MAEIAVPDQSLIVDKQWQLDVPAQSNKSAWTGRTKITGLPGAETWSVKARVRLRSSLATQRPWRAFAMALRGNQNTFRIRAACNQRTGSNPTVGFGATSGYSAPLTGLPVSTTVLRAGDFMTFALPSGHFRLVCLKADLVSNGSGAATASFEPALNEVPSISSTVETINPFALVRNTSPIVAFSGGDFVIDAVEAI
jgi:hypothetical protein